MNNNQDNKKLTVCDCPKTNASVLTELQLKRRGFFHTCFALLTGIVAIAVIFPVISFLGLPKRISLVKKIKVLLSDLKDDQAMFFEREGTKIILIYTNREPKIFDAACTHLGCLVSWDENKHVFSCPCHGAIFDDHGRVVKGPVNTPLKSIEFNIKDNVLVIS